MKILSTILLSLLSLTSMAQVGEYRNDFAVGVNGGVVLDRVGFMPKIVQHQHKGVAGGLSFRYVSEKYFNSICSIYGEVNYAQMGWNERIENIDRIPVVNPSTGLKEQYQRHLSYIQVPVMMHMGWGREQKGFQFFFQAGPQFGYLISESTDNNFPLDSPNLTDRANQIVAQYDMPVEHSFDYGIVAGFGVELSMPNVGHFLLDGRYYYGLGNLYGNSKRDYFGISNHGAIMIKLSYLVDVKRTKRQKQ